LIAPLPQIQRPAAQELEIFSNLATMTSSKKKSLTLNSSSRSAESTGIIDGAAHCFSSHYIWLPPLEHRDEKNTNGQTSDPT
jgi:hypothetical protein